MLFKEWNQTVVILDWDDTLFPTTFVDSTSGLCPKSPADQQTHLSEDEMKERLEKIEECQVAAESFLQRAHSLGNTFIVTLSGRAKLERQCETWYPRVWKLIKDLQIKIAFAMESYTPSLRSTSYTPASSSGLASIKSTSSKLSKSTTSSNGSGNGYVNGNGNGDSNGQKEFSTGYWAHVKGKAIAQEIERFYSQYEGQTWKNVISIGDSIFEFYGTIGAISAYVEKKFNSKKWGMNDDSSPRSPRSDGAAYVQAWRKIDSTPGPCFDSKPCWADGFEGIHEGHMFNVRTKVMKLLDAPSSSQVAQQLTLLLNWLPSMVCLDRSLKVFLDDLSEETLQYLERVLEGRVEKWDRRSSSWEEPSEPTDVPTEWDPRSSSKDKCPHVGDFHLQDVSPHQYKFGNCEGIPVPVEVIGIIGGSNTYVQDPLKDAQFPFHLSCSVVDCMDLQNGGLQHCKWIDERGPRTTFSEADMH